MNLSKNGGFHYEFKDVEDDISFYLQSKEVRSAIYNLVTLPAPSFKYNGGYCFSSQTHKTKVEKI